MTLPLQSPHPRPWHGGRVTSLAYVLILLAMLSGNPAAAAGEPGEAVETAHARIRLVAETTAIAPGRPLQVGIHMAFQEGWHAYWQNPGDSGMPPTFTFTLPSGYLAGDVKWPFPSRLTGAGEVIFGYEGQVLFPCEIQVPASAASGETVSIKVDVAGLLCSNDTCLPFETVLEIRLPVASGVPALDSRWERLFGEGRSRLPGPADAWGFRAVPGEDRQWRIEITPPAGVPVPASVTFFPAVTDTVKTNAPQTFEPATPEKPAALVVERGFADPGPTLKGVLVAPGGWQAEVIAGAAALEVEIPITTR